MDTGTACGRPSRSCLVYPRCAHRCTSLYCGNVEEGGDPACMAPDEAGACERFEPGNLPVGESAGA